MSAIPILASQLSAFFLSSSVWFLFATKEQFEDINCAKGMLKEEIACFFTLQTINKNTLWKVNQ